MSRESAGVDIKKPKQVTPPAPPGLTDQEYLELFTGEMASHGLYIEGQIIADGKLHRYQHCDDKHGRRNVWAKVVIDDHPTGMFGCNKRLGGEKLTWRAGGTRRMSAREREAERKRWRRQRDDRQAKQREEHAKAAAKAKEIFDSASPAGAETHPYVLRKNVTAWGLRVLDVWKKEYTNARTGDTVAKAVANALLVPLCDEHREIRSLQAIFSNDDNSLNRGKDFLSGGQISGLWFSIGIPSDYCGKPIIAIAEGYATGASVHTATEFQVLIAFTASNLASVARKIRSLNPEALIVICADDDRHTAKNPGVTSAQKAAEGVNGIVAVPRFPLVTSKDTDFNDLAQLKGNDEVRQQILAAIDAALTEHAGGESAGPANDDELRSAKTEVSSPLDDASGKKALLLVDPDLTVVAAKIRDRFAAAGDIFDRDGPATVIVSPDGEVAIQPLTSNMVVLRAHRLFDVRKLVKTGVEVPTTLPDRAASLYLAMNGEWQLPPLNGVSTTPVIRSDGSFLDTTGYDEATGLWCQVGDIWSADPMNPMPPIPLAPSRSEAEEAKLSLRRWFRTFPFADSPMIFDSEREVNVVDVAQPPGLDESTLLTALLTAVARSSVKLAPGVLVNAPQHSGSGTGKGLLARAVCVIAFGRPPEAFSMGHNSEELEKRITASLIEAKAAIFLDNVNATALKSDTLASALTESPATVRELGKSQMLRIAALVFIVVTGNAVKPSEDLVRRFLMLNLDARMENPEQRSFGSGFLRQTQLMRPYLLRDALTIIRWGRQNAGELLKGIPLGSFEEWCDLVRDPLLSLGCCDPVTRVSQVKMSDPRRDKVREVFHTWRDRHGEEAVAVSDLHESVRSLIDPHNKGRQYQASLVQNWVGTTLAGFALSSDRGEGKWSVTTYRLQRREEGIGGTGGIGEKYDSAIHEEEDRPW